MISPSSRAPDGAARAPARHRRITWPSPAEAEPAPGYVPLTGPPRPVAREKDPGSAFGPVSAPLEAGRSPLSTGCPGPFQAQSPSSLPVRLAGPVLDCQQDTADPGDVNYGREPPRSRPCPYPRPRLPRARMSALIRRLCPARGIFCRVAGKICDRCPLACHAFGVWITPLGVT